jgi:hypothetical protein
MNRRHLVLGLVAVVLGFVVIVSCIMAFLPGEIIPGPVLLTVPFPVVNDTYPVYRTVHLNITTDDVREMGKLFNLSGEVKEYPATGTFRLVDSSKNPEETLEVRQNSGLIHYQIYGKMFQSSSDPPPVLPSDEEAQAIATQYLSERNLLPNNVHFRSVGPRTQMGVEGPGYSGLATITKSVSFAEEIQGLRVYNGGTTVTIGDRGEIVEVGTTLRPLEPEPAGYVKILTPEEAYRRFLAGDLIVRPACCWPGCVVTDISLGYYLEIQTQPQDYLSLAYAFRCNDLTLYVRAVDPSELERLEASAP